MAVQQNKKSTSKRGNHRRHHISPNGFYRGKKVVTTKQDASEE